MHEKNFLFNLLVSALSISGSAQKQGRERIDSLQHELTLAKEDTNKVKLLASLGRSYSNFNINKDTGLIYSKQSLALAEKINFFSGAAEALNDIGLKYYNENKPYEALDYLRQSLDISLSLKDYVQTSGAYNNIGLVYNNVGNRDKALENYLQSLKFREIAGDKSASLASMHNISIYYWKYLNNYDKALEYFLRLYQIEEELGRVNHYACYYTGNIYFEKNEYTKALFFFNKALSKNHNSWLMVSIYISLGDLYTAESKYDSALSNYNRALMLAKKLEDKRAIGGSLIGLGDLYYKKRDYHTALQYFNNAEIIMGEKKANDEMMKLHQKMALAYEKIYDYSNAYKYQVRLTNVKDTLSKNKADKALSDLQINLKIQSKQDSIFLEKNKEIQKLTFDKTTSQNRFKIYSLLGGFAILLILAGFLYRSNRHKQKAKTKIEQAYTELESTQAQLIQREKMASLGELTAGIAHEIQNPLNFVNNFSEVSNEMIDEMRLEIDKGNTSEAKQIATDIKQNLEKINQHGRRADSIVKGMLQHSRTSTGKKESMDINALTTEYLNLAYHGMRAKDKSFNVTMKTELDNRIGKINIVAQDIGRVILNLINNSFYAVDEKKKKIGEGYEPTISVSTKKANGQVEISVKDNGSGIQQKILDKIFQPFFTTKPTGQGTGLGLSLSYDIVKAHGGELKVETKEGEGTVFVIHLPT